MFILMIIYFNRVDLKFILNFIVILINSSDLLPTWLSFCHNLGFFMKDHLIPIVFLNLFM